MKYNNLHIAFIGEICKDKFIYGASKRLSPEVPVPVFVPEYTRVTFGMAKNVYYNYLSFQAKYGGMETFSTFFSRNMAIKTRYVDDKTNHHFLRVDDHDNQYEKLYFGKRIQNSLEKADVVVISDYNKGFIDEADFAKIRSLVKKGALIFLDTKKHLTEEIIEQVDFIKINRSESETNLDNSLLLKHKKKFIITLGEAGAMYDLKKIESKVKVRTMDVSGAGDTFLAALVYQYIRTKNMVKSITFANNQCAEVVAKRGVSTI